MAIAQQPVMICGQTMGKHLDHAVSSNSTQISSKLHQAATQMVQPAVNSLLTIHNRYFETQITKEDRAQEGMNP